MGNDLMLPVRWTGREVRKAEGRRMNDAVLGPTGAAL